MEKVEKVQLKSLELEAEEMEDVHSYSGVAIASCYGSVSSMATITSTATTLTSISSTQIQAL